MKWYLCERDANENNYTVHECCVYIFKRKVCGENSEKKYEQRTNNSVVERIVRKEGSSQIVFGCSFEGPIPMEILSKPRDF